MGDILPLVAAFFAGVAVEFLNYLITRSAISDGKNTPFVFPLRALIAAAFLAALYFTAKALAIDVTACVIAGAVGATVALAAFTALLMKNNKKGGGGDG